MRRFLWLLIVLLVAACSAGDDGEAAAPPTDLPASTTSRPATTVTGVGDVATTSTVGMPMLVVIDPTAGAVVTTSAYRFRGVTDPGCTVTAAGRYPADVEPTGAWSITLMLRPGSNVASFVATDPAGAATEVRVPVVYEPASGNLGLAAAWIVQLDDGAAFGVDEAAQGEDVNGDGDREDVVAYVVGAGGPVATEIEHPWDVEPLPGGGFAVAVSETASTGDLNGDGDTEDQIARMWTADAGLVDLGMAGWPVPSADGSVWVNVYEPFEGRDLNGDGDVDDSVAHRWEPGAGVTNTGWATGQIEPRPDGTALIGVFESGQGSTDLNGDGDAHDHLAFWWRGPGDAEMISPEAYVILATADGGAIITFEERDGVDLNGDGLVSRWVLRFWHPEHGVTDLPMGTVCHRPTPDGGAYFRVAEHTDYWSYSESCDGGADLNGDGDCNDFVLHKWDRRSGLIDLGLAQEGWCPECSSGYDVVGDAALVAVPVGPSWEDLDGAQPDPPVLHAVVDGDVHDLGIPVGWNVDWAVIGDTTILPVAETDADLNGDGDTADTVFHAVTLDGRLTNLGVAGWLARALPGGRALLFVVEDDQGADLDGDGQVSGDGLVVHIWDPQGGVTNLGVAALEWMDETEGRSVSRVAELPDGRLVVLVPESAGDLNGDGDALDAVVHVVAAPAPS